MENNIATLERLRLPDVLARFVIRSFAFFVNMSQMDPLLGYCRQQSAESRLAGPGKQQRVIELELKHLCESIVQSGNSLVHLLPRLPKAALE